MKKVIKFVESHEECVVVAEVRIDANANTDRLKDIINKYQLDNPDWQVDELVNTCMEEIGVKQYCLEEVEHVFL